MFKTIYIHELKYWLKQPMVYLFALILFALAFFTMWGMAMEPPMRFNGKVVNSPIFMYDMTKRFMILVLLLMPTVMGLSVYRDFSSKMHAILYSYPFGKRAYLTAKFSSAFTVMLAIVSMLGLGFFLAVQMPWVNPDLVQAFNPLAYLYIYGVFLIPNLLLLGVLIFGIVLLSRNIYAGFVMVFMLVLMTQLSGRLFSGMEQYYWKSLLDPFGVKAIAFYTRNWTVAESNELLLPFKNLIIINRLIFVSIAAVIYAWIYRSFSFHEQSFNFSFKKTKTANPNAINTKIGSITPIKLPKVRYDFSFLQQLKATWTLSNIDFKHILYSRSFVVLLMGGLFLILLIMSSVNARGETETLPLTWKMLELPSIFYGGIINVITFLYAGLLVHRERMAHMASLTDASPTPNWVLLGAKFLALVKMQMLLLFLVMAGGIISQIMRGYYEFEIGQYLFNLYGLNLIHFVIWAMLALFIQTLVRNPYLGFFLLLFAPIGFISIGEFGPQFMGLDFLEQMQFRYNQAPGEIFGLRYSDMDAYGANLPAYFLYKIYWALAGMLLLIGALLFWNRGAVLSFKERLLLAKQAFKGKIALAFGLILIAFLSLASTFYYDNNVAHNYFTRKQKRKLLHAAKHRYKAYEFMIQPKIVSVKIDMDIFPKNRQFKAKGSYFLVNKSDQAIDTLMISYMGNLHTTYDFDRKTHIISKDTIADYGHVDLLLLAESLAAGDSLQMTFSNYNAPTTYLRSNDFVKSHGTFIKDDIFPHLGNFISFFEASEGHHHGHRKAHPSDSTALVHSFMSKDADRIDFEATVSTSKDQIALAPGYLQKEWEKDGRRYFYYKMDKKIALSYLFTSGDYTVVKDEYQAEGQDPIALGIYYDKDHPYNIDRMMEGMKAGLEYCTENFSPYQFKQVRIIEFSQVGGASAHGFPNTIPIGEGAGFIANVDDSEKGGVDYAFGTAVHEVAHQWWGHQVIPADVLGSKMVVESLSEYVNVQVKGRKKGIDKMRFYLKDCLKSYLDFRNKDDHDETPLMYALPDQNYIHYLKGALVFYAMSDYLGEKRLNNAIKDYVEKVAFQEGRYTTSIELVDFIKKATPDSLQYLVHDLFETVTFYDNKMLDWTSTPLANGQWEVKLHFRVRKYRSGAEGRPIYSDNARDSLAYKSAEIEEALYSLPLADYIDLGVFGSNEKELYLQKHKISTIDNTVSIVVAEEPTKVAIDPYYKLLDKDMLDARLEK